MEQRTLIVSCMEYYSHLKNIPADKVFSSFEQSGFITMLLDTLRQFPEMDLDFYIGMVDGLTALESDAEACGYEHYTERTALLPEVIAMLAKRHHMDGLEACQLYYHSKTAALVSEDSTQYYKKSAQGIFELLEAE